MTAEPDAHGRQKVERRWINFYEVLQVSPAASQEVIQAAYRVLARNFHPDVNPEPTAAERMRQINAAYRALSDPTRRAAYDVKAARFAARAAASAAPRTRTAQPSSSRTAARPVAGMRLAPPTVSSHAWTGQGSPPCRRPMTGLRPFMLVALAAGTLVLTATLAACGINALLDDTPPLPYAQTTRLDAASGQRSWMDSWPSGDQPFLNLR